MTLTGRLMRTIIEYKDGTTETHDDAAPSVDVETMELSCIDAECGCVMPDMPLTHIKRVVFEP